MAGLSYGEIYRRKGNETTKVIASVSQPVAADQSEWYSIIILRGLGQDVEQKIFGASSLQAVELAILNLNSLVKSRIESEKCSILIDVGNGQKEEIDSSFFG